MPNPEKVSEFRKNAASVLGSYRKSRRVEAVSSLGLLDNRRIFLSPNPEAKARLAKFEKAYNEMKVAYPEFFGLTLYGSHIKGYAGHLSDIDGHVFVDVEKAVPSLNIDNLTEKDFLDREDIKGIGDSLPRAYDHLTKKSHILSQAMLIKYTRVLSNAFEKYDLARVVGERKLELVFLDKDYIQRCSASDKEMDYCSEPILALFNISLDRDINTYRQIVIEQMESEGVKGEEKWKNLMLNLGHTESLEIHDKELVGPNTAPERHSQLYPTLDKARAYFLQGTPKK